MLTEINYELKNDTQGENKLAIKVKIIIDQKKAHQARAGMPHVLNWLTLLVELVFSDDVLNREKGTAISSCR